MNVTLTVFTIATFCFVSAFSLAEESGQSKALYNNVYTVHPSFLHTSDKTEDNHPHDPFAEETPERPQTAKQFFEARGVNFGPGAFVMSGGSISGITLRNTLAEIAKVEAILKVESELQSIASAVREITSLNQEMESAANEQSDVSEVINQNVIEISRSAEQASTDAQETADIAGDLLVMAETLRETIEQFRLTRAKS